MSRPITPVPLMQNRHVDDYSVTEASGGAYIGSHNGTANDGGDWVKYEFTVEADDWHFWGRVIAPSVS